MFRQREKPLSPYEQVLALRGKGSKADLQDIFYCFRLILGRDPNTEEIQGHLNAGIGNDVAEVVRSYVGSEEFQRRRLLAVSEQQMPRRVKLGEIDVFVDEADPNIAPAIIGGHYEPEVLELFGQHIAAGSTVVDIGANIGLYSLLAAKSVGKNGCVFAVEPNSANAKLLKMSALVNGFENITIIGAAASDRYEMLRLSLSYSNGTTSGGLTELDEVFHSRLVPSVKLDDVLGSRKVDLVKIDIEGAEYLALKGMSECIRRHRPRIISEFTPNAMPGLSGVSGASYLAFLRSFGYALSVIGRQYGDGQGMTDEQILSAQANSGSGHIDIFAYQEIAP